jgi:general secretion pathway protein K
VLLIVLFFVLPLVTGVATFAKRSTVDFMLARNRADLTGAEAMARGGVRLAEALLIQDRIDEDAGTSPVIDAYTDLWARAHNAPLEHAEGTLELDIRDAGSRLNLNALFQVDEAGELRASDMTETFLLAFLEKVISELPIPPGEKALYDVHELTNNLIDWIDPDEERVRGGPEDSYYQQQDPPYRAANRPLLSVDELRLIEGFDATLVKGLRPYVTVYPPMPSGCADVNKGCGVNLNTAPPHVLATLYYDDGVDQRLASEDLVRDILKIREEGGLICSAEQNIEGCTPIHDLVANAIFPAPTFSSQVFEVTSEARVGEVRRTIEATVDRSDPVAPRLLSWRVR